MIRLHTLGRIDLEGRDARPVTSVLSQPRRIALLVYLMVADPRGFHRRDRLISIFWPESEDERARNSLSQAIYMLRRSLGPTALLSRGAEEIAVNADEVWCDVVAFDAAIKTDQLDDALALYRGPLLDGFFLSEAPAFEDWLEREREEIRRRAADAAWRAAEAALQHGQPGQAITFARRAAELTPGDEAALRRLVQMLDAGGNRTAALHAYDHFAEQLRQTYGVNPSPQTVALIESIRGPTAVAPAPRQPWHPSSESPRDTDAPTANETRRPRFGSRRRVLAACVVLLLVMVGSILLLSDKLAFFDSAADLAAADRPPAVAVLPFVNVGGNPDDEYFSDGLSEELINTLSRVPHMRVAARTSSFAFKGVDADIRDIGRKLGVSYVVEGSVRRARDNVRITAQLVDVSSGYQLWSDNYDREIKNLFAIQQEISGSIAEALGGKFTRADAPETYATSDIETYSLYLRGRYLFNRRAVNDALAAVNLFRQAIARDSGFALAYAGLADVLTLLPYYRAAHAAEILPEAEAAATRAISLDSTIAEPHSTLGWINFTYRWNWTEARRHFEASLRLSPNYSTALHFYSLFLARVTGEHAEAIRLATNAQRADPLSPTIHTGAGAVFYHARQYDRSIAAHKYALALDSAYSVARYLLVKTYLAAGRPQDAIREWEQIPVGEVPSGDPRAALVAYAYAKVGRRQDALQTLKRAGSSRVSPVVMAIVHSGLGDSDRALDYLARAAEERAPAIVEINHEPLLDPLRSHPRFNQLVRQLNLPD